MWVSTSPIKEPPKTPKRHPSSPFLLFIPIFIPIFIPFHSLHSSSFLFTPLHSSSFFFPPLSSVLPFPFDCFAFSFGQAGRQGLIVGHSLLYHTAILQQDRVALSKFAWPAFSFSPTMPTMDEMAIVVAGGPAPFNPPMPMITVYHYDDGEHAEGCNQLWVREDHIDGNTNMVMYVTKQGHTPFHGAFVRMQPLMASLRFDYDGCQEDIKQVMLVGTEGGGFSGVDYAGRKITMTKITEHVWNANTSWWSNWS